MRLTLVALCFLLLTGSVKATANAAGCEKESGADCNTNDAVLPDYLIVGAGGSGIQMALLLEKYKYTYSVLEKESVPGSFWTRFPVFGELISVNKWTRNETQRLRYDWHSMLETPLRMLDFSDEYFPTGSDWQRYMASVVEEANINIEYGVEVARIARDGSPCVFLRDGTRRCSRRRVFIGTGLREKNEPYLKAMGGIPYSQATKQAARHRRVCILGNGNAGFEIAQNVYGVAERVTLYGKRPHRLSSVTRYTGDVRVKFLQVLENLHGKLLDTVEKFDYTPRVDGLEKIMNSSQIEEVKLGVRAIAWLKQFDCETFYIATGFLSHVPGLHFDSRFPPMTEWYVSEDNPSVHYIGWLMHKFDFQKGAGGFLSGYRYLIRNLVNHIREEDDDVEYPYLVLTKEEVAHHVVARCQVANDLIILQDGVVISDVIVPVSPESDIFHYYEGITYHFHPELSGRDDLIYLYFAWGKGRTVQHVFDGVVRYSNTKTLINLFLHPVIEVNGLTRDVHEDLEMAWNNSAYVSAIDVTIRAALAGDFSKFLKKEKFPYVPSVVNQTEKPGFYEAAPLKAEMDKGIATALWKAVYKNGAAKEMEILKSEFKKWLPAVFDVSESASDIQ